MAFSLISYLRSVLYYVNERGGTGLRRGAGEGVEVGLDLDWGWGGARVDPYFFGDQVVGCSWISGMILAESAFRQRLDQTKVALLCKSSNPRSKLLKKGVL